MASKNERIAELEKKVKEQDQMLESVVYDVSMLIKEIHEIKKKMRGPEYFG
jgi:uncharacterized coiled-coil protein SlyX